MEVPKILTDKRVVIGAGAAALILVAIAVYRRKKKKRGHLTLVPKAVGDTSTSTAANPIAATLTQGEPQQ